MRITERDVRLVRDAALSHLLSRDQTIRLGYFGCVSRANGRLKAVVDAGLLKAADTPFFAQRLYVAGPRARDVVGDRIAALLSTRPPSPRFVRHALAVTEIRIALLERGGSGWRFEPQLRHSFFFSGGRTLEVRPDGMIVLDGVVTMVEADLGNVAPPKFAAKLAAYARYLSCGEFGRAYGESSFRVLTVTTGEARRRRLAALAPRQGPELLFETFEGLGADLPGGWS